MNNDKALAAYINRMEAAKQQVEILTQWLDEMGEVAPDDVNYSHVGTAAYLNTLLDEALVAINKKEDE